MQLHQIKPKHKLRRRKRRIGRGGKKGTYSGRGVKGQKSRAGHRFKPVIRELIKRYPKLRGYKFKASSQKSKVVILNLETLEKKFKSGDKITPEILLKRKLIPRIKGRMPQVKLLAKGKLTKALNFEGFQVSKGAKSKIEEAGGKII